MTVYDLIELLQRVPDKNNIVMFDPSGGFKNEGIEGYDDLHFSIDDVLVGSGTYNDIVYLTENELTD